MLATARGAAGTCGRAADELWHYGADLALAARVLQAAAASGLLAPDVALDRLDALVAGAAERVRIAA